MDVQDKECEQRIVREYSVIMDRLALSNWRRTNRTIRPLVVVAYLEPPIGQAWSQLYWVGGLVTRADSPFRSRTQFDSRVGLSQENKESRKRSRTIGSDSV